MQLSSLGSAAAAAGFALLCVSSTLCAQQPDQPQAPSPPQKTTLSAQIDRLAGQEPSSHIQYVRLILAGSLHTSSNAPAPATPPALIAQCTLRPNGRFYFELFANFGGATDLAFYPPWTPASQEDLFPPRTEKVIFTMDFIGYTTSSPSAASGRFQPRPQASIATTRPGPPPRTSRRSATTSAICCLFPPSGSRSATTRSTSQPRHSSTKSATNLCRAAAL